MPIDFGFLPATSQVELLELMSQPVLGSGAGAWVPWSKPKNCKFIAMLVIGGAAGGGGGRTGIAGTNRGGGSGGGSGAMARGIWLADSLPDELYLCVGQGGDGAAADGTGTSGNRSFVSVVPGSIIAANLVLVSGAVAAVGGGPGLGAGGTLGGAGETIATRALAAFSGSALSWTPVVGILGGPGGGAVAGFTPVSIVWGQRGLVVAPGAGGAGVGAGNANAVGGQQTGSDGSAGLVKTIVGGAAGGGAGRVGSLYRNPLMAQGGTGGGSNGLVGIGGAGGRGAMGSGGGGGGAGVTGGAAGRGGDGYISIASF